MTRTRVGYAGGTLPNPTYERIGDHTEAVEVEFDPAVIGFEDLLEVFWEVHDARRPSFSRQYREAVFTLDEDQERRARASAAGRETRLGLSLAGSVLPARSFTAAEDYHQKYRLRGTPELMADFRALFPDEASFRDSTAAARVNGYLGGYGTPEQLAREIDGFGLSARGRRYLERYVATTPRLDACPIPARARP